MTKPKERDHGVTVPEWWLEKVRELVELRGGSYGELGQALADRVQRNAAWDHGAVSRFLSNKVTTDTLAHAFAVRDLFVHSVHETS